MNNLTLRSRFLQAIVVLMLAAIACNFPASSAPQRPPTSAPMTTEQVQELATQVVATLANPNPSGDVTITITEQELNSYLQTQWDSQSGDQTIHDPQIHLTDGKVEVFGKVAMGSINADAVATIVPSVNPNGKPILTITSIYVGPVPVPDALVSQANDQVSGLLEDYLSSSGQDITVKDITVTEGKMTITGQLQ